MLFQHGAGNFAIPHIPEFSFGIHLSPAAPTFARKAMSETAMLSSRRDSGEKKKKPPVSGKLTKTAFISFGNLRVYRIHSLSLTTITANSSYVIPPL